MEYEEELEMLDHEDDHLDAGHVVVDLGIDPFVELDLWLDQSELDRLEVEHAPTFRERSLASNKLRECIAERVDYRRKGIARSCGPCKQRTSRSGTQFKGRRGANKRAQANEHRRASGFARP